MSDSDKLSWLVMGRPSEGLGGSDLALLLWDMIGGESALIPDSAFGADSQRT
mgnify:CR=1 FL=1